MPVSDPGSVSGVRHATRARAMAGRGAQWVTAAIAAATVIAAFARFHWSADLATHFPLQYAAAALVAGAVLAWDRRPAWVLVALALFVFNAHKASDRAPVADDSSPAHSQPFRLLVANVFHRSTEYGRVIAFTRTERPDAAVFVEVSPVWREALRALERELPYASPVVGTRHGVLVLSRWPIRQVEPLALAPGGDRFLRVQLEVGGRPVELIGVHAAWPFGASSRIRNRQLEGVAQLAVSLPKPLIIAGDFNATRESPHFADMLVQGGLRSAAEERRWAPTWPTFFLPGGIQIDHVLVSGDIGVRRFETGPAVGSDHLPVVADLLL
jgi:endonuclease/exonuclease/phosphatase (EEP) superfamily protein YafD